MTLAVIKTGGKQYLVKEGDIITVEKLEAQQGEKVTFEALLVGDDAGEKVEIGAPVLKAAVTGEVIEAGKTKKIMVVKYKAKTRYLRRKGHRQNYTKVKIATV